MKPLLILCQTGVTGPKVKINMERDLNGWLISGAGKQGFRFGKFGDSSLILTYKSNK